MTNSLYFGMGLLIGNLVGSITAYVVTNSKIEQKYEDQYSKDKKALEEFYEKQIKVGVHVVDNSEHNAVTEDDNLVENQLDIFQYAEKLKTEGYTNYNDKPKKKEASRPSDGTPYVIDPEEAGENDYDLVSLRYWSDGVLTDFDTNEIIEDSENLVGDIEATMFDEEANDLYIRNDRRLTDYEIILDERDYISSSNYYGWDEDND